MPYPTLVYCMVVKRNTGALIIDLCLFHSTPSIYFRGEMHEIINADHANFFKMKIIIHPVIGFF